MTRGIAVDSRPSERWSSCWCNCHPRLCSFGKVNTLSGPLRAHHQSIDRVTNAQGIRRNTNGGGGGGYLGKKYRFMIGAWQDISVIPLCSRQSRSMVDRFMRSSLIFDIVLYLDMY